MKAIGIIGYHHTGKTTAACALISALKRRGYTVSSIKDIHDERFYADKAGSNSDKHAKAGSSFVLAKGLHDSALIFPENIDYSQALKYFNTDFLVIEGMKNAPVPKIVCAETEAQLDELLDETAIGISGPIADRLRSYRDLPVFCLQQQLDEFVSLCVEKAFPALPDVDPDCCSACGKTCYELACAIIQGKATRVDCILDSQEKLELRVNGKPIRIVPFVQNLLRDSILSFVKNLKDIDPDGTIDIHISARNDEHTS